MSSPGSAARPGARCSSRSSRPTPKRTPRSSLPTIATTGAAVAAGVRFDAEAFLFFPGGQAGNSLAELAGECVEEAGGAERDHRHITRRPAKRDVPLEP